MTVAPPPQSDEKNAALTAGSRYGFGVTSQIILGKYADHLPLYRLEDVFARAGVVIPRSTQVDLLSAAVYLGSGDRILASCCHAHARRKFEAAKSNDPTRASRALAFYRQLYDIEDRAWDFSATERLALPQSESVPILGEFKAWLDEQAPQLLPKSTIAGAVRYALKPMATTTGIYSGRKFADRQQRYRA